MDVDAIMRYFAVNTFLVNFDSYTGNLKHNYYLYKKTGYVPFYPGTLTLHLPEINAPKRRLTSLSIHLTVNLSERPLMKLLEVPEYKELYYKYLNQLVADYITSGKFENTVQKLDTLINSSVKNDATAFYSYAEYEKSLPVLVEFARLRAQSITAQLTGKQPLTTEEQSKSPAQNIDAKAIDLSALGGMGGKGGGPRPSGAKNTNPAEQGQAALPGGNNPEGFPGAAGPNNSPEEGPGVFPGAGGPGNNIPGASPESFPRGNMPDEETMKKVMEIMQQVKGDELSAEQIAQLKELGLDDTMIARMKNRPPGMPGPDGAMGRAGNAPPGNRANDPFGHGGAINKITPTQIAYLATGTGCILLGLFFIWKFKRRKYSS